MRGQQEAGGREERVAQGFFRFRSFPPAPRGARVSPGPASRMPRAEWWPCPLWAPRHPPLDPVSTSCIRGSAFGPCGAFSPLADAAVLQTLTHPGLITTGPQRRERLLPVHTCRGPRLKGRSCRRELTRRCSVLAETQNRSGDPKEFAWTACLREAVLLGS